MSLAKETSHVPKSLPQTMPFQFGTGFLHDHVGQIIDDPTVAILELVANSYDAGADSVAITYPKLPGEMLSITETGPV
jgi:hypothetical protein